MDTYVREETEQEVWPGSSVLQKKSILRMSSGKSALPQLLLERCPAPLPQRLGTDSSTSSVPPAALQPQVICISVDISHDSCLLQMHLAQLQPLVDATGSPRHAVHFPFLLPTRAIQCRTDPDHFSHRELLLQPGQTWYSVATCWKKQKLKE